MELHPSIVDVNLLELKCLEFQEHKRKPAQIEGTRERVVYATEAEKIRTDPTPLTFDASKHIKCALLPWKGGGQIFLHFEKVANSLEWPKEMWMLLLKSVLIGKAREVYSARPIDK